MSFPVTYYEWTFSTVDFPLGLTGQQTYTFGYVPGSVLVAFISVPSGTGTVTTLSGGGVATWNKLVSTQIGGIYDNEIWWGIFSGTGGSATLSYGFSTSSFVNSSVYQFSTTGEPNWYADPVTSISGSTVLTSGIPIGFAIAPSVTGSELLLAQTMASGENPIQTGYGSSFEIGNLQPFSFGYYWPAAWNAPLDEQPPVLGIGTVISGYIHSFNSPTLGGGTSVAGFLYTYDYPLSSDEPISHTQITQPYYNGTASYYYVKQPHIPRNYTKSLNAGQVSSNRRQKLVSKLNTVIQILTSFLSRSPINHNRILSTVQVSYPFQVVHRLALKIKQISQNLYGGEQLYTYISHHTQHLTRAINVLSTQIIAPVYWLRTKLITLTKIYSISPVKQVSKSSRTTQVNITRMSKLVSKFKEFVQVNTVKQIKSKNSVFRIVQIRTVRLSKSITKSIRTTLVEKAGEIGETFYRIITPVLIFTLKQSKLVNKFARSVKINTIRLSKHANKNNQVTEVQSTRLNKAKQTNVKTTRIQNAKISKLKSTILRTVQTNIARFNKIKSSALRAVQIQTIRLSKTKNAVIRANKILSIRLSKVKSTVVHSVLVEAFRQSKLKSTVLRVVQVSAGRFNKIRKAIIRTVVVYGAIAAKGAFQKTVIIVQISAAKINKQKNVILRSVQVQTIKLKKIKTTIIRVIQINTVRLNKQKNWIAKSVLVQSIKQSKTKSVVFRVVRVSTTFIRKSVNKSIKSVYVQKAGEIGTTFYRIISLVLIRSTRLSKSLAKNVHSNLTNNTKLTKKASKNIKSTQVVEATITRSAARKRKITSGITYTIASNRTATRYRQLRAVMINTFRTNKGIHKDITASNTNTALISKASVVWRFLIQLVTKIVSSKSQIINKPGHALPDPNPWDPNMIDSSTPSADGLVYGNPDDDR